ncbi:MAG: iron-containing alcohol dehydrogenase [Spirochaetaceae bacterium]|jgi:alcohol dehydrogenase YqhD (iron-dependent ADH family)|nr:iron-containing alcohol dehydrogenase [Spirochaetaceae bacterium]
MNNFEFQNTTKIIFGRGSEENVGREVSASADKILLHYGGGSIKSSGLYDRVTDSLKKAGVTWIELGGVKPNPRLSLVEEGIQLCKENNLSLILAVGGGSVIDSSKAIAMGAVIDTDVWDFYLGKGSPQKALPVGTVLTLPAAGSEASSGTVITNENGWLKRAVNSDLLYPKFSILNPELCYTLPKFQVACGLTDIMAHLMERYFTNTKNVSFTDNLIEATMKTIINQGPHVIKDSEDYDSWAEIMWAGTIAHNNLLNTGRDGDWASHDIEHEISGIYDVAHGAGLAVVFPAWMKYVLHNDLNRFVQWSVRVWNVDMNVFDPESVALEGIRKMKEFFQSLGLKITLSDLGIKDDRIDEMADKCTDNNNRTIGNFVKLNRDAVKKILIEAK